MKDYNKETDEVTKQEKSNNKELLAERFTLFVTIVCYICTFIGLIILIPAIPLLAKPEFLLIICVITVIKICRNYYQYLVDNKFGYYECEACHYRYIPTSSLFWKLCFHYRRHGRCKAHLKCPKCNKKTRVHVVVK